MNYSEIKYNKNEKKLTLANNQDIYNFTSDQGIKFGFYWTTENGSRIDETVGTIKITQFYYGDCIGDNAYCDGKYDIPLVPCNFSELTQKISEIKIPDFSML